MLLSDFSDEQEQEADWRGGPPAAEARVDLLPLEADGGRGDRNLLRRERPALRVVAAQDNRGRCSTKTQLCALKVA